MPLVLTDVRTRSHAGFDGRQRHTGRMSQRKSLPWQFMLRTSSVSTRPRSAPRTEKPNHVRPPACSGVPSQSADVCSTKWSSDFCSTLIALPPSKSESQRSPPHSWSRRRGGG